MSASFAFPDLILCVPLFCQQLLDRIPLIRDLSQRGSCCCFCASARANYFLRVVYHSASESFALQHDTSIWQCFSSLSWTTSSPSHLGSRQPPSMHGRSGSPECSAHCPRSPLGEINFNTHNVPVCTSHLDGFFLGIHFSILLNRKGLSFRASGDTNRTHIRSTDPAIQSCFHLCPCSSFPWPLSFGPGAVDAFAFCLCPCLYLCLWLWDIPWRGAPLLHIGGKNPPLRRLRAILPLESGHPNLEHPSTDRCPWGLAFLSSTQPCCWPRKSPSLSSCRT